MNTLTVSLFWQGELSLYEVACLNSFLLQGFEVDVYAYHALALPDGVNWRDAREILPFELCQLYTHAARSACPVAFSDLFRYCLLSERGGLWVDGDVFCLKPVQAFQALQSQAGNRLLLAREDALRVNTAVMMVVGFHPLLARLYKYALEVDPQLNEWGALGPLLLTDVAQAVPQQLEVLEPASFYPIHYLDATEFLLPACKERCLEKCRFSYALHIWNSLLLTYCLPKNILPPEGSFLYDLFARVLPVLPPALPEETLLRLLQGTQAIKRLLK
jgi:hypothetical protein